MEYFNKFKAWVKANPTASIIIAVLVLIIVF